MRRRPLLLTIMIAFLFLFLSCENNVYIDKDIDKDIWRVGSGNDAVYFRTANAAINYVMENTFHSRSVTKTDDPMRTITLMCPVLAEGSDGITDSNYEKYVTRDEYRGSITIPEAFTGNLCIDFNGYRYDFSNSNEAFFTVKGGDNIYIYNGHSVIFNEASHEPYAITVNTDTVTIDEHLVDDRRVDNSLLYIGESGHVRIENVNSEEKENTMSGTLSLVTDGKSGAVLEIESSSITFDDIYTMYKEEDGTVSEIIDDTIEIDDAAKSRIDIYSGDVNIRSMNKKTDYYNSETDSVFDKAIINVFGSELDTNIDARHEIYETVEKAIENSQGSAKQEIIHDMIHHETVDATCVSTGVEEYWTCSSSDDCIGRYYTEKDGSAWTLRYDDLIIAINPDGHKLEHVERKEATCTEEGNIEYWHCTLCDKYFQDEKATKQISKEGTVLPHHNLSDWDYDINEHWKNCPVDGKVLVEAHTWGEWQEHVSGSVTHLFAECKICGARKTATKPEYLVYDIGIGEVRLKNIEDTPCGDFYVDSTKVESGAQVAVAGSFVTVSFVPYLGSNVDYTPYCFILNGGNMDEVKSGIKDSEGNYSVVLSLENAGEYALNIQLNTGGGSLGFECYLNLKK